MAYSHCTGTRPGEVHGTGPTQKETMDPGSFPCLGPVWIFLYNILVPTTPGPTPVPVQILCSVNKP